MPRTITAPWRALLIATCLITALTVAVRPSGPPASRAGAAQSGTPAASADQVVTYEELQGGGARNIVKVTNQTDDRLRIRGNIQLNHIPGPTVGPVNVAEAYASCTDCETLAIALQINLISREATRVVPQNAAIAINYRCTRCRTAAIALQYTYSVDDPKNVPPEVEDLIREMDRELHEIGKDRDADLAEAVARIDAVLAQFTTLAESLADERDETEEETSPNATPLASPDASDAEGSSDAASGQATETPASETGGAPASDTTDGTAAATRTPTPVPTTPVAAPTSPPGGASTPTG